MAGSGEYRGPVLEELKGRKRFTCECCIKLLPITSLDIHHILMQQAGGGDERDNLALLCVGCHQTVHRIGLLLASTKQGKASPEEETIAFAHAVNPEQWSEVRDRMLGFAVRVAVALASRRDGTTAVGDADLVIPDWPPRLRKVLQEIGKEIKSADGRAVGMAGVATAAIVDYMIKRRPEIRDEAYAFLHRRYQVQSQQGKQIEEARKVAAAHGINLTGHRS